MNGIRCKYGYISYDKCLECPNRCIDSTPIKEAIIKSRFGYFHDEENEFHVTSLIGCPRKAVLDHITGQYPPPLNIWKMQLGTLCHEMCERIEREEGKGLAEMMLSMNHEVEDILDKPIKCTVKGKFDFFDYSRKVIRDHKFKWNFNMNYLPSPNHFRQLATYEMIARRNLPVKENGAWSDGGEVKYYDIKNGQSFIYPIMGDAFYKYVEEQRFRIPEMLFMMCDAKYNDILPPGERRFKECFYCPPEINRSCKTRFPEKLAPVIERIEKYRKEVTDKSPDMEGTF